SLCSSRTFIEQVCPQRVARSRIDRDCRPVHSCGEIQRVSNHQRRDLPVRIGPWSETFTLPTPDDLKLVHILRLDLIQRRILRSRGIAAIPAPFAVHCSTLCARDGNQRHQKAHRHPDGKSPSFLCLLCFLWFVPLFHG